MANINVSFDSVSGRSGLGNYEVFVDMSNGDTATIYPPNGWMIAGAKLYQGTESGSNGNDGGTFTPNTQKNRDIGALKGNSPNFNNTFSGNPGFSDATMSFAITNAGQTDNQATITDHLAAGNLQAYEYLIWIQKTVNQNGQNVTLNDFLDPGIRNR